MVATSGPYRTPVDNGRNILYTFVYNWWGTDSTAYYSGSGFAWRSKLEAFDAGVHHTNLPGAFHVWRISARIKRELKNGALDVVDIEWFDRMEHV